MALDVAEHLWTKFLSSLEEAVSELSGSTSIFIPYFIAIKNVVKEKDIVPEPYTYCEGIPLLYELNDAFAECRNFARKSKERNKKLLLFNPFTHYFTQRMKNRLTAIKRELENLEAPREEIANPPDMSDVKGPILSSKVFGFEKYVEKIESLLFKGSSSGAEFTGIGVVGIPGVGKTTLVQKVLKSQRVTDMFNPIIWLPFLGTSEEDEEGGQFSRLSFETCILDNLGNILEEKVVDIVKLLERLNQLLSGKRYLIVLDDVYHRHIDIEERLWHGLPKARGGAVIVTSSVTEVAQKLIVPTNLVLLEPLKRDACWQIFEENINNDKEFSSISREILEKIKEEIKDQCHGLPLAAKTLAEIIPKQIRETMRKQQIELRVQPLLEGDAHVADELLELDLI